MRTLQDIYGEPISRHTRAQALDDGCLIDVSTHAKEIGIKLPVAVTGAVWCKYIEWTDKDTKQQVYQDTEGRLHDVLWMFMVAAKSCPTDQLLYKLYSIARDGKAKRPRITILKAIIGPGDTVEPVITIMLPNED